MEMEGGERGKAKQLRIVLVPWLFQGHINPMFLLGSILHEKGFSVTVAHAEFIPLNPSSHPDFSFIPLPDGFSGRDVGASFGAFLQFHSAINTKIESLLFDRLAREIDSGGDKIACIIYDTIFCNVESVAHRLAIPSVSLHTTSATCLLLHLSLPSLQQSYIPIPDGIGEDIVPGLDPLRFKDLDILQAPHVQEMLPFIAKTSNISTAAAVILNTSACLEQFSLTEVGKRFGGVPVFALGPLFKLAAAAASGGSGSSSLLEENTDCLKWLDRQAPGSVIYVSMGSLVSIDTVEFEEMGHALADSEQPFLWVVRPGLVQGEEGGMIKPDLVDRLPERVKRVVLEGERGLIVEWAPQKEVLDHEAVGGFLSHCGWSSTLESMSAGVAMVCRPGFGDQWLNARYVSGVWGAGLELGGGDRRKALERGEIERAIRKLMLDDGEEMRKKASDMKSRIQSAIAKGTDLDAFLQFIHPSSSSS